MTENQLRYLTLEETKRHNLAAESIDAGKLAESARSNLARENVQSDSLSESIRSNLAREKEAARANRMRELETFRSNQVKEIETNRSNVAAEKAKLVDQILKFRSDNFDAMKMLTGNASRVLGGLS